MNMGLAVTRPTLRGETSTEGWPIWQYLRETSFVTCDHGWIVRWSFSLVTYCVPRWMNLHPLSFVLVCITRFSICVKTLRFACSLWVFFCCITHASLDAWLFCLFMWCGSLRWCLHGDPPWWPQGAFVQNATSDSGRQWKRKRRRRWSLVHRKITLVGGLVAIFGIFP